MNISRRSVFGLGGTAALTAVAGVTVLPHASAGTTTASTMTSAGRINETYRRIVRRTGGKWWSYITMTQTDGSIAPVVGDEIDQVVSIYSVNKVAVAAAVWDKIERGELALDQKIELRADLVESSEGIYYLQTVYGDQLTLANVMTAMLLVSDNTAVRLCGTVCSGPEVNGFLERKGFVHTRVEPKPDNPNRFYLGTSTPRETHTLLRQLAEGTLVSPRCSQFILRVLTGVSGVHDGVRHRMSSAERARVATKFGAFSDGRHEAGVVFDAAGAPALTYVLCAKGQADADNFGATHPAVMARSVLGRVMYDAVNAQPTAERRSLRITPRPYRGSNGG